MVTRNESTRIEDVVEGDESLVERMANGEASGMNERAQQIAKLALEATQDETK